MAAYIHEPVRQKVNGLMTACTHLVADSEEELHLFAAQCGLKRSQYQNHINFYYLLWGDPLHRALRLGANIVSEKEIALLSHNLKQKSTKDGN
jgi:hypothetical protein